MIDIVEYLPLNCCILPAMSKANSSSGATVCCPICKEEVSGVRFAPHLEKCMNGGKRGGKKFSKAIDDYTYSLPMKTYKPRNIPEVIDPHPESLIIKVKLRNGGKLFQSSYIYYRSAIT